MGWSIAGRLSLAVRLRGGTDDRLNLLSPQRPTCRSITSWSPREPAWWRVAIAKLVRQRESARRCSLRELRLLAPTRVGQRISLKSRMRASPPGPRRRDRWGPRRTQHHRINATTSAGRNQCIPRASAAALNARSSVSCRTSACRACRSGRRSSSQPSCSASRGPRTRPATTRRRARHPRTTFRPCAVAETTRADTPCRARARPCACRPRPSAAP